MDVFSIEPGKGIQNVRNLISSGKMPSDIGN